MLRVLTNCSARGPLRWLATAQLPFWQLCRSNALLGAARQVRYVSQDTDSEEEDKIIPEGRKGKGKGPTGPLLRSYLDPLKLVPLTDHLFLFDTPHRIHLKKPEYDALSDYFKKTNRLYIAASVARRIDTADSESALTTMNQERMAVTIAAIKSSKDVHNVGILCSAQTVQYGSDVGGYEHILMLTPKSRMKIKEWIQEPSPIGLVKIEEIMDRKLREEDLDLEQQVSFRYARQQLDEISHIMLRMGAPQQMNQLLATTQLGEFINNSLMYVWTLTRLLMIGGGMGRDREQMQEIFGEEDSAERLRKLCVLLIDTKKRVDAVVSQGGRPEVGGGYEMGEDEEGPPAGQGGPFTPPPRTGPGAPGGMGGRGIPKMPMDERVEDVKKFRKNIETKKVPAAASKRIEEEIGRYMSMDKNHPESVVIRTYLDYLTSLPWGITTTDSLDIPNAKKILDEGHYGMDDIKERILEFLAVGKLQGKVHGKILCFIGPPGVGKTSIGESIAKAVSRKFFRISLGGDRDTSTLKGFRRTYVGAIPGKIAQGMRNVQVENPVILIDEIDKLGIRSVQGDPSSVLLEILDPEQNSAFTDDYIDVPIDLSKVLFLCTANVEHTIPKPLLDRMEIINVSGYTHAEKEHILSKYLLPQAIEKAGLKGKESQFKLSPQSTKKMIEDYCREPGVRGLQRAIKRIMEKIAYNIVNGATGIDVNEANLEDYIGSPPFNSSRIYPQTPTGVVCGLSYSELGGSITYIEATEARPRKDKPSPGQLTITGSLGDVMKESIGIAHTLAKQFLMTRLPDSNAAGYLESKDVHVHVPEGAVPKEGPSAGVAITTALISLALHTPAAQNVAMTGEVTLMGKVLPIGGVKEKVLAAQREGIKKVILPKENEKDYNKLPDFLKKDLEVKYADDYTDVFQIMFPGQKMKA